MEEPVEYSLDKFRQAEKEGQNLSPEERDLLDSFHRVERELDDEEIERRWAKSTFWHDVTTTMSHLFDSDRHLLDSDKGQALKAQLEKKLATSTEGQLELAQEEAGYVNREARYRLHRLQDATRDWQNFLHLLDGRPAPVEKKPKK